MRLIVSWSRVEPKPGRYNERYLNRTVIGNQPGNQGTKTQEQPKAKASTP